MVAAKVFLDRPLSQNGYTWARMKFCKSVELYLGLVLKWQGRPYDPVS